MDTIGASVFLSLCGVLTLLVGCVIWDKRRENANFRQGEKALDCGDLDLALSCANEEIRHESKRSRGLWLRGQALHRKGMHKEAIEDYSKGIKLTPERSGLYRLRGESYAALGLYSQAIADYSDAIPLDPADITAIARRKEAYAEREARGDASQSDLSSSCAILAEPPSASNESTRSNGDCDPLSAPIHRPTVNVAFAPKVLSPLGMTGFILGLASVVLYAIGLIPILGIVFSAIGLGRFNPETQKAKWMAGWGLALSILFTIMFLTQR